MNYSNIIKVTLIIILSTLIFVGMITYLPDFSRFGAIMFLTGIALGSWFLFDKYVLTSIDTLHEIKRQNIAFAIVLLAIAIVMHGIYTGI